MIDSISIRSLDRACLVREDRCLRQSSDLAYKQTRMRAHIQNKNVRGTCGNEMHACLLSPILPCCLPALKNRIFKTTRTKTMEAHSYYKGIKKLKNCMSQRILLSVLVLTPQLDHRSCLIQGQLPTALQGRTTRTNYENVFENLTVNTERTCSYMQRNTCEHCMRTYICRCLNTYIHTYTHTCIHTHIDT